MRQRRPAIPAPARRRDAGSGVAVARVDGFRSRVAPPGTFSVKGIGEVANKSIKKLLAVADTIVIAPCPVISVLPTGVTVPVVVYV